MDLAVNKTQQEWEAELRDSLQTMRENHQLDMAIFWLGLAVEETKDATKANTLATIQQAIVNLKGEVA